MAASNTANWNYAEDDDDDECPKCGSGDIEYNIFEGSRCNRCGTTITQKDIVEDYYETTSGERLLVSSHSVPKPAVDNTPFDPYSDAARAAFDKYRKKFKNRRRYQRDREKRYM